MDKLITPAESDLLRAFNYALDIVEGKMSYCECGRKVVTYSKGPRAKPGYITRQGHDLCKECWTRRMDSQRGG